MAFFSGLSKAVKTCHRESGGENTFFPGTFWDTPDQRGRESPTLHLTSEPAGPQSQLANSGSVTCAPDAGRHDREVASTPPYLPAILCSLRFLQLRLQKTSATPASWPAGRPAS